MNSPETIIEPYIELESGIRRLMTHLFSETCAICTACCCRVDICEEALQSAFLSMLIDRQELSAGEMDDRFGWLEQYGCMLEYGRPPVCYTYFCDELLARLPDNEIRHIIRVLGRLVEYVGEDALDGLHLADIKKRSDLEKVDFEALSLRLEEALTVFRAIEQFVETGRLGADEREAIAAMPAGDS